MKPNFISEDEFAAMAKRVGFVEQLDGKNQRVQGSTEGRTPSLSVAGKDGKRISRGVGTATPPPRRVAGSPAPAPLNQSFFVPGPLPGANDIIRKHWRVYTTLKADWGLTCARCILIAKIKPVRACTLAYHWVEPLPRKGHIRDRDNIRFGAKFINDALVTQGVLVDDGPDGVVSMTDTFAYQQEHHGVAVTITEVQLERQRRKP